jgi:hypothetical protein
MAITNYWSGHTVESAKKERERLKKKGKNYVNPPRKADNLDDVPSYAKQRANKKQKEETYALGEKPAPRGPESAMFETIRQATDVRKRKK